MKGFSFLFAAILAACTCASAQQKAEDAGAPLKRIRIYYIGNSVTDTVQYGKLAEMALKRGFKFEWGRQMIPGAPLSWIYQHPDDGFREDPYGTYKQALPNFEWDVVSLQPFDRHLGEKGDDPEGDITIIQKLMDLTLEKSPEPQFFIYSRWPRMSIDGKGAQFDENAFDPMVPGSGGLDIDKLDDWEKLWLRKYTGGWDGTNETRDYFERLAVELRKANQKLKKPILIIPVGDVMLELDRRMKAGKVKGYKTIWQFYKDGIHMGPNGSYLTACTFFACITGRSPEGLPFDLYGVTDPEIAKLIQETSWKVVGDGKTAEVVRKSEGK